MSLDAKVGATAVRPGPDLTKEKGRLNGDLGLFSSKYV